MAAQVIIKLIPDTSAMPAAEDAIEELAGVDKATADQIRNTNKAFQERAQATEKASSSTDKLAKASKSLTESIAGGAINQAASNIDKLSKKFQEGGKGVDTFKASIEAAKQALATMSAGTAEFDNLSNEIKAATASFDALNGSVANTPTERLEQLNGVLESLKNSGLQGTQTFKGLQAEAQQLAQTIDNASEDSKAFAQAIDLAKKKLATLSQDDPEFDRISKEIEAASISMGNFAEEATSSRGKLRQYRETLLQLEDAGLEGTQIFEDMAIAAGELSDAVGDTQARIKALSSDTFELDTGIEIARGVAAGFAVAQGAAALFGEENEELQKTLLKVNAAMSILQGLQEISNILQAQSNTSIAIGRALRQVEILQTNLQTAAESKNVIVRYAAIAAQKALNAVMALSPAGILLLTIGALAGALLIFSQNTETAAEKEERLNQELEKTNALLDEQLDYNERLRNTRAGGLNDQQQQLDILKANGALQSKILTQERKVKEVLLENEKVRKAGLEGQKGREKEYDESAGNITRIEKELALNTIDIQNAQQDESLKSAAAYADARVAQAIKGTQAELNAQIAAIKARRTLELSDTTITAGERAKIVADSERQIKELRENFQREQLTAKATALEAESALTLDLAKKLELDRAAVILKAQADSIGKTKDQQIIIEKQKQAQIKQIDDESTRQILGNRLALYEAAATTEKDNAVRDELQKQAIIVRAQIDSVGKSAEEQLKIEKQKIADIDAINVSAANRRGEINIIRIRRTAIGETNEIKKLEIQKQEVIAQAEIDSAGKTKDEILKIEEEKKNALLEIDKQIELARKESQYRLLQTQLDTAVAISSALNEIAKNQADAELNVIQKREDEKLKALQRQQELGTISQEQYNKRAAAIQEEYDRKARAIKMRAAQQEKQLALFQAGIAQSLAILSVLKDQTIPFATKPIFIGLAISQALAQIAAIASKPIPAFNKGTKNAPGGPSLIGEAGPELYYADGKWGYAAGPTILDLPKGAKVVPTLETEKILQKYDIPMPKVPAHMQEMSGLRLDYSKLAKYVGREVGREIEKIPVNVFGYDADGPWRHTTTMQNRQAFLNKKYGRKRR